MSTLHGWGCVGIAGLSIQCDAPIWLSYYNGEGVGGLVVELGEAPSLDVALLRRRHVRWRPSRRGYRFVSFCV